MLKTMGFYMSIELQRGGYIGSVSCINQKGNGNGLPFSSVVQISEDGGNSVVTYNAGQNKRPSTRRTLYADVRENAESVNPNAQPSDNSIRQLSENSQDENSSGTIFSLCDSTGRELTEAQQEYFKDSKAAEQLARENRSLAERIRQWIRKWVRSLKAAMEGLTADRPESAAMMQYAQELQEIWDNALVDAARNGRGTVTEAQRKEKTTNLGNDNTVFVEDGVWYSVRENFSKEIDSWVKDDMPEGVRFTLGSTGPVMQGLGAIESDIYMEGDKIKKIMQDHPEMTLAEIKKVPQILEDPALILKSEGRGKSGANSRLVCFGLTKAQNGQPVMTVMDLRPRENGFVVDDMQKVNSAYTKNNPMAFIQKSDVVYADKKRAIPLLRTTGLTISSQRLLRNGYIGSISYKGSSVNIEGVPFSSVVKMEANDKVQNSLREPRLPDRDYSYDALTRKPDMTLTVVNDRVKYQLNSVSRKNILEWGIANGKKVGRSNENGNAVVRVKDTGEEVILSKAGLRHGLHRRFAVNAPVVLRAGEILQNAIRINELTPKKDTVDASYVLVGAAKNKNNEPYIVQFVVNRASNEVTSVDVLYAINAKKEPAALLPEITGEPATLTDSSISISNLLDYVNRYFPDILPEDVLKHYGHDARPAGELGESALFQQRESRLSDRDVLRMAARRTPGGCRKG